MIKKKTCLKCDGTLEKRIFIPCRNEDGSPSIDDTSEEHYCPNCKVFWLDFEAKEDEIGEVRS